MKLSITTITIATLLQSTLGFTPISTTTSKSLFGCSTTTSPISNVALFAEPNDDDDDDDEGGLDLNLEEMFDMYVDAFFYRCLFCLFVCLFVFICHTYIYFCSELLFFLLDFFYINNGRFDAADKGEDFDKAIKEVKK